MQISSNHFNIHSCTHVQLSPSTTYCQRQPATSQVPNNEYRTRTDNCRMTLTWKKVFTQHSWVHNNYQRTMASTAKHRIGQTVTTAETSGATSNRKQQCNHWLALFVPMTIFRGCSSSQPTCSQRWNLAGTLLNDWAHKSRLIDDSGYCVGCADAIYPAPSDIAFHHKALPRKRLADPHAM